LKITILGTRGEIPNSLPYHSKHTGILVDDELLIDVGEKEFLKWNPQWILISHFHPDHAYFIRRGKQEAPPANIPIYAPEKPSSFQSSIQVIDGEIQIGPYVITPIPTHHSKHVKSYAYVIRKQNHSFLYTGDLVWINKEYHPLIGIVDLVITEASFIRKQGMVRKDLETGTLFGHNGVPNLIKLLKPFSSRILFIHFGSWFYKNVKAAKKNLIALGKENDIQVLVGYDGFTYVLHEEI
jgi:glyoxylase-like metal-dependent hydrolase (beta-lactamase superfamily II)